MKLSFKGKNVLVTGGNSEIGLTLAELLINSDLYPVLTVRNNKKKEEVEKTLLSYSGKFGVVVIDFTEKESLKAFTDSKDIPFDYLVDLYQSDYESLVAASDIDKISEYFTTNITVRAELIRFLSREMLKRKFGRMIFVSSAAANFPAEGQGFYSSSKLASEALYKNTGVELGKRGVTTFTIRPGYIDSGRGKEFLEKKRVEYVIDKKRVCESILFFLSTSSEGFNAGCVVMDNGFSSGK